MKEGETARSLQISSLVRWVKFNSTIFFQDNVFAFKEALLKKGVLAIAPVGVDILFLRDLPEKVTVFLSTTHDAKWTRLYNPDISFPNTGCCSGEKFLTHELIKKSVSTNARAHSF
jgi:hypothetical protein